MENEIDIDIDLDDLDNEIKQLFDPKEEIRKIIYGCSNFRRQILVDLTLHCALRIAANNESHFTTEDRFELVKKEIEDRNNKDNPLAYTMSILGLCARTYTSWKAKDYDALTTAVYKLTRTLASFDDYWSDRIFNFMEENDEQTYRLPD
jgi:hypothetical protein